MFNYSEGLHDIGSVYSVIYKGRTRWWNMPSILTVLIDLKWIISQFQNAAGFYDSLPISILPLPEWVIRTLIFCYPEICSAMGEVNVRMIIPHVCIYIYLCSYALYIGKNSLNITLSYMLVKRDENF